MTYEIFQIRCCSCKEIYDVRTYYNGKPVDVFPCDDVDAFSESVSDGYCPSHLEELLEKIEIRKNGRKKIYR